MAPISLTAIFRSRIPDLRMPNRIQSRPYRGGRPRAQYASVIFHVHFPCSVSRYALHKAGRRRRQVTGGEQATREAIGCMGEWSGPPVDGTARPVSILALMIERTGKSGESEKEKRRSTDGAALCSKT